MERRYQIINMFASCLCVATAASTILPFARGRSIEEAAHVLTFCGTNLWEVSPIWGTAVVLGPLLFLAYRLCEAPTALVFPLTIYQETAVPAALAELRKWAAEHNIKLLTGLQSGWAVYICLSILMMIFVFWSVANRKKADP